MMPGLATLLLLAALCTASLLTWGYVLQAAQQRQPPLFPACVEVPPRMPRLALVLGGLVLMLFLADPVAELAYRIQGRPLPEPPEPSLADVQLQCGVNLAMSAVIVAALGGAALPLRDYGFYLRPFRRQWKDAVVGFHLAIGPVFLALIASELIGLRGSEPEHELLRMLVNDGSGLSWFWISLTAVVAAPVAEELLFRVLLQGVLTEILPGAAAVAISSLVFCVVHKFPDSLALLPLAVMLGFIYLQRRSYLTVVLIHALFNAVNLLLTALAPPAA
jgi:membrane protease YdiL (CAAX protease family)